MKNNKAALSARLISLVGVICFATMLVINANSWADTIQDGDMAQGILGTYRGKILHWGRFHPISTTFHRDAQRGLAGSYVIAEEEGPSTGDLTEFRLESKYTALFSWSDKDGTGTVRIVFSEDFEFFTGFWGPDDGVVNRWYDGGKQ